MNFDNFAEDYGDLLQKAIGKYGEDTSYYAVYKVSMMKRNAENKAPLSVLDFGCGVGRSLPYLCQVFPQSEIWGCDASPDSIRIAQKSNPQCFFFSPSKELPRRFDLILISCVFHHIPLEQRDTTMLTIKSLMNAPAELFVFEHNPYNPLTRHVVNTCPFDKDVQLLPLHEMKRRIVHSGLTVVSAKYTLFFPASLKRFQFLEPLLFSLPIGGQYMVHARYDTSL